MDTPRIMIVEDDGLIGSYMKKTIENLGYVVTSVAMSGEDAVATVLEDKPDLITMDIKLGGRMDGIETAAEIRGVIDVPVIYLTAHSDTETLKRAKITEPYGYVVKPFESRELHSNIEMALYKHKMEKELKRLALYDGLTGLPNRTLFLDRLNQAFEISRRDNQFFVIMYFDLDGFKNVNDTLGHDAGDVLLKEVAQRFNHCVRRSDTVARLGGDEFTAIIRNVEKIADVSALSRKVLLSVGKPFNIDGHNCSVGVSIGISIYPIDGRDAESLMKKADAAMFRAKQGGKNNYRFFSDAGCKTSDGFEVLVELCLKFVLDRAGKWNHAEWLEFVFDVQQKGLDVSGAIQDHIGLMLESLKQLYRFGIQSLGQAEKCMNHVSRKTVEFMRETEGIWGDEQWKELLASCDICGVLPDNDITNGELEERIGSVVEEVKLLYIILNSA